MYHLLESMNGVSEATLTQIWSTISGWGQLSWMKSADHVGVICQSRGLGPLIMWVWSTVLVGVVHYYGTVQNR